MACAAELVLPAAAGRELGAGRSACEGEEGEVLDRAQPSLEEDAEEEAREDGLHLTEELEGRRVDVLQDEEEAVVVNTTVGKNKSINFIDLTIASREEDKEEE